MDAYLAHHGINYANASDVKAAAHDAIDEFTRVVMGPYEAQKMDENTTVWACLTAT